MAQWIAFLLIMGLPVLWLFVAHGPDSGVLHVGADQPAGGFRLATAELEVGTGPTAQDEIQDALDQFLASDDRVPDSVRMALGIAAAEVAANIVEHSDANKVRMALTLNPNRIEVGFVDDGAPLEVDLAGVSMPEDFAESGRGLAMAKVALSDLSYERGNPEGNHWRLVSKPFEGI